MYVVIRSKGRLSKGFVHDLVSCKYPSNLSNFRSSSTVGDFTLVHRNCMGMRISGLPLLPRYKSFAMTTSSALLAICTP
jgi:hypothetical protein